MDISDSEIKAYIFKALRSGNYSSAKEIKQCVIDMFPEVSHDRIMQICRELASDLLRY